MRGTLTSWSLFLAVLCGSVLYHGHLGFAKEVEVTKEWQLLGENDTIPAGMHVRIDMTTGEKWVKQIDEDDEDNTEAYMAVIHDDGSVEVNEEETVPEDENQYEMMHRTLSKLPEEETERFGGLPELPQGAGKIRLTSKEREAFEKRMAEIWEKRQVELKELQESMMDFPEVLKERIKSIKKYLSDPVTHLNDMKLDDEQPEGFVTHIVSVLQDLEFQLTDVDIARDFHTLGGWQLLVSLLSEEVHVPQNKTTSTLLLNTEANMRAVQAHAAWAIGTAVKNTGEFFPFAIEELKIGDVKTTAIDLLIDVFCKEYKDPNTREVRTLLAKSVYGIGALLRGNRMTQEHVCKTDSSGRLGEKFSQLSLGRITSANTKLIQRLLSLASDLVSDVKLHSEESTEELKNEIIESFTSSDWCGSISNLLVSDSFLPVQVQESLLQTVEVLAPNCAWADKVDEFLKSIENIQANWQENNDDFDPEHLEQLLEMANKAMASVAKANER